VALCPLSAPLHSYAHGGWPVPGAADVGKDALRNIWLTNLPIIGQATRTVSDGLCVLPDFVDQSDDGVAARYTRGGMLRREGRPVGRMVSRLDGNVDHGGDWVRHTPPRNVEFERSAIVFGVPSDLSVSQLVGHETTLDSHSFHLTVVSLSLDFAWRWGNGRLCIQVGVCAGSGAPSSPSHPCLATARESSAANWSAALLDAQLDRQLVRQLGALPLLIPIIERLRLREVINHHCHADGTVLPDLDVGRVVEVLAFNRLLAPRRLVRVEAGLANTALPDLLGLDAAACNDDRLARALDALVPHLEKLWQDLIVGAVPAFGLDLSQLANDITSVSFCGEDEAETITDGDGRDHRPDGKQLELATPRHD
jgi:hypothetical protein